MNAPRELPLGVVPDMPAHQYHALDALSSGAINAMARSPFHCWAQYRNPARPERTPTPAMVAGTLAHCAVLEPDELGERYAVRPAGLDLRTKEGKAWAATVPSGADVVTAEQMATAQAQRAAVLAVPELAQLLSSGRAEQSAAWIDTDTGVACKCRPDWVHELADGRVIVLDLKTTADPSPEAFARSVHTYGYHRQAAHYSRGWRLATGQEVAAFVFAAVSSDYPFIAVPYLLDDAAQQRGEEDRARLTRLYAECLESGRWPAFGEGVQLLSLPPWALARNPLESSR